MTNTLLKVFVKPNARTIKYKWLEKDILKVDIPAPPEHNKANLYLIDFLSKKLGIDSVNIQIKGGTHSKHKYLSLPLSLEQITQKLA